MLCPRNVIPIFKSGDETSPGNNTPVSLILMMEKVMESSLKERITDMKSKLMNSQHRFQKQNLA